MFSKNNLKLTIFAAIFSVFSLLAQESNPFTITTSVCDVATTVSMTGPWWGWDPVAGPVATDNGDGTWTFAFDPAPTDNMEYLLVLDGVQENLVASNTESDDWSCTPVTDYWSYANRMWTAGSGDVSNVYGTCGTECPTVVPQPTTASVEFTVDMNGVNQPSEAYDQVTINGSWNGWNGWGLLLSDVDLDGIYTGVLELEAGTSFEYVVAVSGEPDGFSGWGIQWGDGCVDANVLVTAGDVGTVTPTSLTPGCSEILGCMDTNGTNFDASATAQAYDQYGNLGCIFTSCDDIPEFGCIYGDGFGAFNVEFGAEACITYGGSPCTDILTDINGCIDPTATNYNATATVDDGSCTYQSTALTIITSVCDVASTVSMTGPWWGWDLAAGPVASDNGDGTWTFTFDPAPTDNMEYLLIVDGVQENLVFSNTESDDWSCTPLTDYWSYANRMWTVGSGDVFNVYGTCGICSEVSEDIIGCTDVAAVNYDATATVDNGSCTYESNALTMTTSVCDFASTVSMTGPWWGWDPAAGPVATDNGDGTWTFTFDPAPTDNMEYLLIVDGVQENLVVSNTESDDWSCTPLTDYWSYANRMWTVGSGDVFNVYGTCGICSEVSEDIIGCTDVAAVNYDATATVDNGSCTYESNALTMTTSVCDIATTVSITGPFWGWDPVLGPVATDNGDGTWTFTFDPAPTENMEYLLIVDGVQENLVASNTESDDWSCTPVTDYWSYANRMWTAGSGDISNVYGTCGTECPIVDPEPTTATVEFTVDMNGVDQPSSEYALVTVNGSWNGWNGWGAELFDEDGDGVWTGYLQVEAGTVFEYVVSVSGEADSYSGWGPQWGNGCVDANVLVTAGDVGSVTQTSLTPGCSEILGCMDTNASNFDASATAQAYDQYGNLGCIFTSCDDIPEFGCIYGDGFGAFNDEFGPEACITYGGTACSEIILDAGCIDSNASNYEENAVNQSYDQYGNSSCIYVSCDDIPEDGCIYGDGFGAFNDDFGAEACETYGGIACTTESIGPDVQQVNLVTGWSNFSTYMIPADMDIAYILAPVIDNIIITKDYLGSAYLPEWNFNGIGDITTGQAYQIKTIATSELSIEGEYAFPEDNPVALGAGWNLIGYLRIEPTDAASVFFDINATGNLVIIKDYLGSAYLPEWNFNGIGNMLPGAGYQVKTNNADTLQYLSNDDSYKLSSIEIIQNKASYFDSAVPTDNNMTIVIEDAAWPLLPKYGDEIAAYDRVGNLVGSVKYTSPVTVLTVWGSDATTITKDGMSIAEDISFKGLTNGLVVDLNVRKCEVGSSVYYPNAIIVVSSILADVTPMDMQLLEAVPNPSSSITQISFLTTKSSLVNISLYNTLGELVKVITQSTYSKGSHTVLIDAGTLKAGSYFYKMTTETFSKTKRLSVLK